ncbi:hypothetical protein ACFLZ7_04455 [Nanoarchaeota archaeon]
MHHVVNEDHQRFTCVYCRKSLLENKWKSKFSEQKHYKCTKCGCGKEARVKVGFIGSGHDSWEKKSALEHKIEIIG